MESREAENRDETKVESATNVNNSDSKATREEAVRRCILVMVHALECHAINCQTAKCHGFKKILQHTHKCQNGQECPVCKQLTAICYFHAKKCTDQECKVPFCKNIQAKNDEALIREFELVNIEDIEQNI